jgi:hypothetical protein
MLSGCFSAWLADRFDNRRVVIARRAVRWSSPRGWPCSPSRASSESWPYFVLAFLGGGALVFDAPNRHALTYQLVGRDELPNAIALNSSLFNAGRWSARRRRRADRGGRSGWCFAINSPSFLAVLTALC